jgi:hypothetical protein
MAPRHFFCLRCSVLAARTQVGLPVWCGSRGGAPRLRRTRLRRGSEEGNTKKSNNA